MILVPKGYMPAPNHVNVRPLICGRCGASVLNEEMAIFTHDQFHMGYDEIVEWAQSISALFAAANKEKVNNFDKPSSFEL